MRRARGRGRHRRRHGGHLGGRANDGIVDQRTVFRTATRGHAMVQRLEKYGVKFEKDEYGEYAVRQVHRSGRYVLPMPEGRRPARTSPTRSAATEGLREFADVLPADEALAGRLRQAYASTDTAVRRVVVELLRVTGRGTDAEFRAAAEDVDVTVRLQAVRGLTRRDDVTGLAAATRDPAREVRVAAAHGLGTIGDPRGADALCRLTADDDVLVRAAPDTAVAPLLTASRDDNLDVRRAAVRSLSAWTGRPDVAAALREAAGDPDADVRAWARRALA